MSISTVISSSIAKPRHNWDLRHNEATTQDIVQLILWADDRVKDDTKNFAKDLQGYCLEETANNIHHALTKNVKFVEDPDGVQMLKSPAQLWNDKKGDCKSFALFTASALQNLGIDYTYRFVSETTAPVHHVYVVVTDADGTEYIIDPTVKEFNKELPYNHRIDHVMQYRAAATPDTKGKGYANGHSQVGKPNIRYEFESNDELNEFVNKKPDGKNKRHDFSMNGPAHIGDPFDNWIANKGMKKIKEAIDDKDLSPLFIYLFYPQCSYSEFAMPRLVLKKQYEVMKLYTALYAPLAEYMAVPGYIYMYTFYQRLVDAYFNNVTSTPLRSGQSAVPWLGIKWGPLAPVTMFVENNVLLDNILPIVPAKYKTTSANGNIWYEVSLESITAFYKVMWDRWINHSGNKVTQGIAASYSKWAAQRNEKTFGAALNKMFDLVKTRSAFVCDELQWGSLQGGNNPDPAPSGNTQQSNHCTWAGFYSIVNVNGKAGIKLSQSFGNTVTFSTIPGGLSVGDKVKFLEYGPASLLNKIFTVTGVLPDNKTFTIDAPFEAGDGMLQMYCDGYLPPQHADKPTPAATDRKLIMWLDAQQFQSLAFEKAPSTLYAKPRKLFIELIYAQNLTAYGLLNSLKSQNTLANGGYVNIQGVIYDNGRFGLLLDSAKLQMVQAQKIVAIAWQTEKKQLAQIKIAQSIQYNPNGTYKATVNGINLNFDPDGIIQGYASVANQVISINGRKNKIGVIPQATIALLAAIGKILGSLATLIGVVTGAVLGFIAAAKDTNFGDYRPNPDDLWIDCIWYDEAKKQRACINSQGDCKVVDESDNVLGDCDANWFEDHKGDFNTDDETFLDKIFNFIKSPVGLASTAGVLLLATVNDDGKGAATRTPRTTPRRRIYSTRKRK